MEFILWTVWIVIVAVMVNIVMERLWDRIGAHPSTPLERDEVGSLGRHRSK